MVTIFILLDLHANLFFDPPLACESIREVKSNRINTVYYFQSICLEEQTLLGCAAKLTLKIYNNK